MSDDLRARLVARFGALGLRPLPPVGADRPPGSADLPAECGIPRQVGPYFVSRDGDPALLGAVAETGTAGDESAKASWRRLGTDGAAWLCLDPAGRVRAEFGPTDEPGALVNASAAAFLDSLVALDEALALIGAARDVPESAGHIRTLLKRLANIEEEAVDSPDSWWSRVVEDLRHSVSQPAFAAFEFTDADGKDRIISDSGSLCLHPEERIWGILRETGIGAGQVKKVHTELEPCFMPGHYCTVWLAREFPHAEFTHSFDYGQSAESREAGFLELLRQSAAR